MNGPGASSRDSTASHRTPLGKTKLENTWAAQLMVIAKEPVPGRVKTRLTPAYTPAEAAELAEAALADTLAAVASTSVTRRILALAGTPRRWLRPGFAVTRHK